MRSKTRRLMNCLKMLSNLSERLNLRSMVGQMKRQSLQQTTMPLEQPLTLVGMVMIRHSRTESMTAWKTSYSTQQLRKILV